MKRQLLFPICLFFLLLFPSYGLMAETIYMNDGQILNGKILSENDQEIQLQTKYQTKVIQKRYISRIIYKTELERVQIVTKDGQLINGFLVSQDLTNVIYKASNDSEEEITLSRDKVKSIIIGTPPTDKINILTADGKITSGELVYQDKDKVIVKPEDSPETEQTIDKDDIKKISYDTIRIYDSEFLLLPGLGIPFGTGEGDLGMAPAIFVGYLINNPYIKKTRILFEGGYLNPRGKSDDRSRLHMIPVTANLLYYYPLKYFDLVPRLGFGLSPLFYKNKIDEQFFGIKPIVIAGVGGSYPLWQKRLFLMGFLDYSIIFDGGARLSTLFFTVGVSYRVVE